MRNWFKKLPAQLNHGDTTPGGSRIIDSAQQPAEGTHGGDVPMPTPPVSMLELVMARETFYIDMFGNQVYVDHELEPLVPHIDVYSFPPGHNGRSWWTIVTGGMSDLAMTVPADVQGAVRHREIILYTKDYDPAYSGLLRYFARYPHRHKTWLGWGHTITNGTPPTPLFANSTLLAVLFLTSPLLPDKQFGDSFEMSDGPVEFLWLVPISASELDFKLRYGTQPLLDIFDRAKHPFVLDPQRFSYA